jgi:hypothetical protein
MTSFKILPPGYHLQPKTFRCFNPRQEFDRLRLQAILMVAVHFASSTACQLYGLLRLQLSPKFLVPYWERQGNRSGSAI